MINGKSPSPKQINPNAPKPELITFENGERYAATVLVVKEKDAFDRPTLVEIKHKGESVAVTDEVQIMIGYIAEPFLKKGIIKPDEKK